MPSESKSQQHVMGAALAAKRGQSSFPMANKIAKSMTMSQLRDFAGTKTKGLPAHVKPPTKRQEKAMTKSSYR